MHHVTDKQTDLPTVADGTPDVQTRLKYIFRSRKGSTDVEHLVSVTRGNAARVHCCIFLCDGGGEKGEKAEEREAVLHWRLLFYF